MNRFAQFVGPSSFLQNGEPHRIDIDVAGHLDADGGRARGAGWGGHCWEERGRREVELTRGGDEGGAARGEGAARSVGFEWGVGHTCVPLQEDRGGAP